MKRQVMRFLPEGAVEVAGHANYFVTRDGRVFSNKTGKVILLRATVNRLGYHKVAVGTKGAKKLRSVHRLVAEAFVPNPEGKPEVNHRDLDKLNNVDVNLEWVTHAENLAHARANRKWRKVDPWVRLVAFPVWPENDSLNLGKTLQFESTFKACEHFGKKLATFAPMVQRGMKKQWKVLGYWWRRER